MWSIWQWSYDGRMVQLSLHGASSVSYRYLINIALVIGMSSLASLLICISSVFSGIGISSVAAVSDSHRYFIGISSVSNRYLTI